MKNLNVVLYQPKIPQNTGNIVRTCAAVGAKLHLIRPLGFSVRDRYLRRAGLDYWHLVEIVIHDTMDDFFEKTIGKNLNFITKKARLSYEKIDFSGDVFLVFGKETSGLPEELLQKNWDRCFRIPMKAETRSLNLSNAVAVVVYEAYRQAGFERLQLDGSRDFD